MTSYDIVEEDAETKLNQNESPWDVPAELKDEVARRLRDLPWNRYHQTLPSELLTTIARDAGVAEDGVIAASGSNLILQWIFGAWAGSGRTALLPTPSFSLYPLWAQASESRVRTVSLNPDLEWDVDAIVDAVRTTSPDLTVLCLPNNPTGSEMSPQDARRVADEVAAVGGLLVIDEAYREFSGDEFDRTPLVRDCANVILVRTCSKAFSAAGMRLGYALAAPEVARELRKLVPPFHLNLFATVFGQVVWERKDVFTDRVREIIVERDRLMQGVGELPGVRVFPSAANFFLFRTERSVEAFDALRDAGILVRKLGGDPLLDGCLRVNAGTREENDRFLSTLKKILEGITP